MEPVFVIYEPVEKARKAKKSKPVSGQDPSKAAGPPGGPMTKTGMFVLCQYAKSVVAGHPDTLSKERFKDTAIGPYMDKCEVDEATAEFWAQ